MSLDIIFGALFFVLFIVILLISILLKEKLNRSQLQYYKEQCTTHDLLLLFHDKEQDYSKKIADLESQIASLKALPAPTNTLTIEAQQILHDLTAHGNSIVRITPLSPTDVFWKAPR